MQRPHYIEQNKTKPKQQPSEDYIRNILTPAAFTQVVNSKSSRNTQHVTREVAITKHKGIPRPLENFIQKIDEMTH